MHRFLVPSPAVLIPAVMAVTGLTGCDYNSPMQGDDPGFEREAGMQTFNEQTGGVNEDPLIGGGQAGFDQ